jgi:FixJ family two-component response regulator
VAPQLAIFVIDDDASVRKALQRLLRSEGMAVKTFASAEDFLAADLPLPDCLVLDVRMSGMSGVELQLRLLAEHGYAPIVFITAHDDEEARASAMAAGAVAFLHKPFEDHVLLDAISQAVARNTGRPRVNIAPNDLA